MLHNKLSKKSLGIFIVTGFCVLAITGTVRGDIQSDTTLDVEWLVKVSSLAYDSTYECTESYHQYYIQNNSDLELKFTFEFSHKVYSVTIDPETEEELESFVDSDVIDQEAPPGTDTLDNGESDTNWWWNMVDMSGLSGPHRIRAYTELRVRQRLHGHDSHLFTTRQARETHDFSL